MWSLARADSLTDHQWEEEYERENANAICDHQIVINYVLPIELLKNRRFYL
jgi:hypothetical protein